MSACKDTAQMNYIPKWLSECREEHRCSVCLRTESLKAEQMYKSCDGGQVSVVMPGRGCWNLLPPSPHAAAKTQQVHTALAADLGLHPSEPLTPFLSPARL